MSHDLVVTGAREHNLKNISLRLPRDRFIVITGLSGSGKSSLAFDTIYAEGQRRYVESLSAYARQFLGQMDKPDVDCIEGLSPAISIDQKTTSRNPRSTVGTVTEIYDYLRLLYARVGIRTARSAAAPSQGSPSSRSSTAPRLGRRHALQRLAPVVRGRKGEYGKLLEDCAPTASSACGRRRGARARRRRSSSTRSTSTTSPSSWTGSCEGGPAAAADRLRRDRREARRRPRRDRDRRRRDAHLLREVRLPALRHLLPEIQPRIFCFNNPYGACPACHGLGSRRRSTRRWSCRTVR